MNSLLKLWVCIKIKMSVLVFISKIRALSHWWVFCCIIKHICLEVSSYFSIQHSSTTYIDQLKHVAGQISKHSSKLSQKLMNEWIHWTNKHIDGSSQVSLAYTSINGKTENLDLKNSTFLTVNYFGHRCHFTTGYWRTTGISVTMKVYPMDTIIELEGECNNINMYIRQGVGRAITRL